MKHSFDVELALKYGVMAAIAFDVIANAMKSETESMVRMGKRWVPFGYTDIKRVIPYVNPNTVQKAVMPMREDGVLEAKTILSTHLLYFTVGENGKKYLGGCE